jgi:protein ImuA
MQWVTSLHSALHIQEKIPAQDVALDQQLPADQPVHIEQGISIARRALQGRLIEARLLEQRLFQNRLWSPQLLEAKAGSTKHAAGGFENALARRAVHELLFNPAMGNSLPMFPALLAARAAIHHVEDFQNAAVSQNTAISRNTAISPNASRMLIWIDPNQTFYPPAAIALGIAPSQLCVLRPEPQDLIWAAIECLRCQGVGAVVALMMQKPTRVEVRRLQLAAEKGGAMALLVRPNLTSAGSNIYAANTRWLVTPAPGERTIQRWSMQLLHGQVGPIGQSFLLEKNRATGQTNLVHPSPALVHHQKLSAAS